MIQSELVSHLTECGCVVVREDKNGYFVMRNPINGEFSGVPVPTAKNGHYKPSTICQICKKLCVPVHEDGKSAEGIIDHINERIINKRME